MFAINAPTKHKIIKQISNAAPVAAHTFTGILRNIRTANKSLNDIFNEEALEQITKIPD